ncbi:MAG: type II toxin-antitoxin system RelE/ParE family toxin [Bacteroidota bacterium]
MRIEYATLALERILEIAEHRFPDASERARTWMSEAIEHASRLEVFPHLGRRISSWTDSVGGGQHVRRLLFRDVWIVCEVRQADPDADDVHPDDHILVLTVRHVREQPGED